jgi:signal transduction histidine kinase
MASSTRSPLHPRVRWHDLLVAGSAGSLAVLWSLVAEWPTVPAQPVLTLTCALVGSMFAAAGTVLVQGVTPRRSGYWLLAAAALNPLNGTIGWDNGPLPLVRGVAEGLFYLALAGGLLAYQGRGGVAVRLHLTYLALLFVIGQLALDLTSRPGWQGYPPETWWPPHSNDPGRYAVVGAVIDVATVLAAGWFVVLLVLRQRRAHRLARYTYDPVVAAASVAMCTAAAAWIATGRVTLIEQFALATIPISFLAGGLRAGVHQTRSGDAALEETRAQIAALQQVNQQAAIEGLAERRRLERSLHDGPQQHLLALATTLGLAGTQTQDSGVQRTLAAASGELHRALGELRALASGIHPAILTSEGLAAAVRALADKIPVTVDADIEVEYLPEVIEATAYHLIREALASTAASPAATRIKVLARVSESQLRISVSDDRAGVTDPPSSGLQSMLTRIEALGGDAGITCPTGSVTRLTVRIPLTAGPSPRSPEASTDRARSTTPLRVWRSDARRINDSSQ